MKKLGQCFSKLKTAARKRLRTRRGFSFTEMLAAVIILLIASEGLAHGISFASRNFRKQMRNSESRILFSTIEDAVNYELENGKVRAPAKQPGAVEHTYEVTDFYSPTYTTNKQGGGSFPAVFMTVTSDNAVSSYGYVRLCESSNTENGKDIITRAAYTYGTVAKIGTLKYYDRPNAPSYYEYTLSVGYEEGGSYVPIIPDTTIQVMPLDEAAVFEHES